MIPGAKKSQNLGHRHTRANFSCARLAATGPSRHLGASGGDERTGPMALVTRAARGLLRRRGHLACLQIAKSTAEDVQLEEDEDYAPEITVTEQDQSRGPTTEALLLR